MYSCFKVTSSQTLKNRKLPITNQTPEHCRDTSNLNLFETPTPSIVRTTPIREQPEPRRDQSNLRIFVTPTPSIVRAAAPSIVRTTPIQEQPVHVVDDTNETFYGSCKPCSEMVDAQRRPQSCSRCHHYKKTPAHRKDGRHVCPTTSCKDIKNCPTDYTYVILSIFLD